MTKILRTRLAASEEEIAALCRRHQIAELAAFGSVLRDDFRDTSDLDLLVSFQPDAEIGFLEFARAQRELGELLKRSVDLVPKTGLKSLIREEILASMEPVYAR